MPKYQFLYLLQCSGRLVEQLNLVNSLALFIKEKKSAEFLLILTTSQHQNGPAAGSQEKESRGTGRIKRYRYAAGNLSVT